MAYDDCGTHTAERRHRTHGEEPCRPCMDAKNEYQRVRRTNGGPVRLPFTPLGLAVRLRDLHEPSFGITRDEVRVWKAYYRAKRSGHISRPQADLLAVHLLHVHPSSVWPEWFGTVVAA